MLRKLDRLLGRGAALEVEPDPLPEQIARLGDEQEARELERLLALHGATTQMRVVGSHS